MDLLRLLERRFRRYAISRLTLMLVVGQVVFYTATYANPKLAGRLALDMSLVGKGEVWRLVTFIFLPGRVHPIFIIFALYLFYLMGGALEHAWGKFRFNVYFFFGWLATLATGFIPGVVVENNAFLAGSIFLAFAWLYPEFELLIFFVLPVKVKYLAILAWLGYGLALLGGDWTTRALVGAGVANFLLFFSREIVIRLRGSKRRMGRDIARAREAQMAFHRCVVCGVTEKQSPTMDFRICSQCDGGHEYCAAHIDDHEHVLEPETDAGRDD